MTRLHGKYDAVIFDMDGTLLDTEALFRLAAFEAAAGMGFEMTDALHHAMIGNPIQRNAAMLAEAFGADFSYVLFDEKCDLVMRDKIAAGGVPVKPGAVQLLNALAARGIPIAVATSSGRVHARAHLERAGLMQSIDVLVTRDDVTNHKPHPEPYLAAARQLGVEPGRCVAFEDSHSGVRAAHAAGMHTIMVPDLLRPTDEIEALCHAVLPSLDHAHDHVMFDPEREDDTVTAGAKVQG